MIFLFTLIDYTIIQWKIIYKLNYDIILTTVLILFTSINVLIYLFFNTTIEVNLLYSSNGINKGLYLTVIVCFTLLRIRFFCCVTC